MKILLVGEYNASHKLLKDGLTSFGHDVTVVGLGDGFKKRTVDVNFTPKYTNGLPLFIKKVVYRLFKIDLTSLSVKKQFFQHKSIFQGNDIVQLINENAFECVPSVEKEMLEFIFSNNKNVFLLSCGTDYVSVKYASEDKFDYSILTPYNEKRGTEKQFQHVTKYLLSEYVALHTYVYENIKGVIASDLDYHIPLQNHPLYLGMVPNPINLETIRVIPLKTNGKLVIFHGINKNNYFKKGNDIFEAALDIIAKKYPKQVDIITLRSVPYDVYIESYDKAHIMLDQVFAYDQGFNALEAMAKGKVVFTGAEKDWLAYYGIAADTIAINALPNVEAIADKLSWLIENPSKITEIGTNARAFVEKEHDQLNASKAYLAKWKSVLV
jgi:glycosyltransferase involved in cell wall biosynthesis